MIKLTKLRLSQFADIVTGATPKAAQEDSWGKKTPFITPSDQSDSIREATPTRFLSDIGVSRLQKQLVPPRSTNLTCIGSIGKVSLATASSVTNQQINSLVAKQGVSDADFLYYLIKNWSSELKQFAAGSATPIVNKTVLGNFEFGIPHLKEQRAIAEVLGALDDKIAANNKVTRTTEQLGATKFRNLGMDVEPTNTGVLLDELFDLNPRRVVESETPTVIDMQALPTTTPLVDSWNIGIRKGGTKFTNGDTLIARITPCLENRKTAFVDFLGDGDVGIGSTEFIVLRSRNNLPLGLSYFMATSDRFRDFAIQNLVGTSGRQRVSAADLARHTLSPVDPLELQSFGEWADSNLRLLGAIRNENQVLATTRDALLPQLMSGKLRVKDVESLVESVV